MYQGNNPSALKSVQWIETAFLHLISKKKYESITVKDICRTADLSRQTFYQFYKSKEDVLFSYYQKISKEFDELNAQEQINTLSQLTEFSCVFWQKHIDVVKLLIDTGHTNWITYHFSEQISKLGCKYSRLDSDSEQGQLARAFLAGAFTQVLIFWIQSDTNLSIGQVSELICNLLNLSFLQ